MDKDYENDSSLGVYFNAEKLTPKGMEAKVLLSKITDQVGLNAVYYDFKILSEEGVRDEWKALYKGNKLLSFEHFFSEFTRLIAGEKVFYYNKHY